MNSNQLLLVPHQIAKLASELLEFQWFLDDDDIIISCDAIELQLNDEVAILLHELKDQIGQVDAVLAEICVPGSFVKTAMIAGLTELLKQNCLMLKELKSLLEHHESSPLARKDAASLKEDYEFFGDLVNQWVKDHHQRSNPNRSDDDEGGSPVHACDLPEPTSD